MAIDVKLNSLGNGYFDIAIEGNRIGTTSTGENLIYSSILVDNRASIDDANDPLRRRGWVGSLFRDRGKGSLVWLLEQSRNTVERRNLLKYYIENCLQWAIDSGIIKSVDVTVDSKERGAYANIAITTYSGKVNKYVTLWEI